MWKKLLTIYLIFGLSLAILISLSLYSFQRFNSFLKYAELVDRNNDVLTQLNELQIQLAEIENNHRAYILFNDTSFHVAYDSIRSQVRTTFGKIYQLLKGDPDQRKRLQTLNFLIRSQFDHWQSATMVGYPTVDYQSGKRLMARSHGIIKDMQAAEQAILQNQLITREFYEQTTPQTFRVVFVFTVIVFVVSFVILVQQYRDRLNYQQKLEKNILELNQANAEWEQIAYVASHDLQEPLRKIRTFCDLLISKYMQKLNDEGQLLVQRIDAASARAQFLMLDIVNYNMIVYTREEINSIDLDEVLSDLLSDMRDKLSEKHATVQHQGLPVVQGYPSQLTLLFKCLIENSLKFGKPAEPVLISITASVVHQKQLPVGQNLSFTHYHKIVFEDNGIGFENQFADKIFKMFQRLHPQESTYEGRGIGLAMVKRVVTNHTGFITARGRPGRGSRFTLYFPVR
jgi:signal transduction histidine kinase